MNEGMYCLPPTASQTLYTTCGDSSLSESHFGIAQVQTQVSEVT